jgi:SAM-dependent methyltransferase
VDIHDRIREWWDADARTYDAAVSHAVSDPTEAAVWRTVLRDALPEPRVRVLDVGAGTGAMSLLLAELGYGVTALDVSAGMLSKAREKTARRGVEIEFVLGSAMEPPPGPFDAILERHVIWTVPDPEGALRAWREVAAPGGRLVLLEGVWRSGRAVDRLRGTAADVVRGLMRLPDHHHAPYPGDVLRQLPLAQRSSPEALIAAVQGAGWTGARIKRLRDVEWAQRRHRGSLLGWLEQHERFALIADA